MNIPPAFTGHTRGAYLNRYAVYAATVTVLWLIAAAFCWAVPSIFGTSGDCGSGLGICDTSGETNAFLIVVGLYLGVYLPALGGGAAWTVVRTHPNWSRWRRVLVSVAVFPAPWTQLAVLSGAALFLSELNVPGLVSGGLFVAALALPVIETMGFAWGRWRSHWKSRQSG